MVLHTVLSYVPVVFLSNQSRYFIFSLLYIIHLKMVYGREPKICRHAIYSVSLPSTTSTWCLWRCFSLVVPTVKAISCF